MVLKDEKFDFRKVKTLMIMLNDNLKASVQYFYPKSIEEIEDFAEFVRYIVTPEDYILAERGVESRTFEIYKDLARENLYYLVQRFPLEISNELDFILTKDAGQVNVQKIIRDRYFAILNAVKEDIIREFDAFVFVRFKFTGEPVSTLNYVMSKDFEHKVPLIFPDVAPSPLEFSMKMGASILTPTINLYLLMPRRKILYDFTLSTVKITKLVGNKVTYIIELSEYLDNFFKAFVETIYPV